MTEGRQPFTAEIKTLAEGQWYGPRPRGAVESRTSTAMKEDIMQVVRIGLDLAKYVFEVHGVSRSAKETAP
jgi:hypothetical protein